MDLQKLVDAMNAQGKRDRGNYHVTLGAMIEALEKAAPYAPVYMLIDGETVHPGDLDSYRGYYSDLAFDPIDDPATAAEVLAECKDALGKEFTGYKGGEFYMDADTPLWVSAWGRASSIAIMNIDDRGGEVFLVTKPID